MKRKRTRDPRSRPTTVIGARIAIEHFALIELAAAIRDVELQEIVIRGTMKEARAVVERAMRAIRLHKERQRRARAAARRKARQA